MAVQYSATRGKKSICNFRFQAGLKKQKQEKTSCLALKEDLVEKRFERKKVEFFSR